MNNLDAIRSQAEALVAQARACSAVVTIELKPRQPPAMGHYDMVVDVRPARELAIPAVRFLPPDDTEGGAL